MSITTRRTFLSTSMAGVAAWGLPGSVAWAREGAKPQFEISLAEWSLHRTLRAGKNKQFGFSRSRAQSLRHTRGRVCEFFF